MSRSPDVSVVIPVYNGKRFIRAAVQSVLDQEFENFELIVVDNVSEDGSLEEISCFVDARIRVVRETHHLPIFANFNRAAAYGRGRFLKFLCADDMLLPGNLGTLVPILDSSPSITIVTSCRIVIDERGNELQVDALPAPTAAIRSAAAFRLMAERGNFIGEPSTALVRKSDFDRCGGFSLQYRQLGDLDLWCRLLALGDLYYHSAPLSKFRCHSQQLSALQKRTPEVWLREELILLKRLCELLGYSESSRIENHPAEQVAARILRGAFLAEIPHPSSWLPVICLLLSRLPIRLWAPALTLNLKRLRRHASKGAE